LWATFSGSLPPGAPVDGYARLIAAAQTRSVPALVDTHGEPLRRALAVAPAIVKVNTSEASEIVGMSIENRADAVRAARLLRQMGAGTAIITLGAQGVVAAAEQESWFALSPPIEAVATVGSGDAFLGGLILYLSLGRTLATLRYGVAAGAPRWRLHGHGRPGYCGKLYPQTLESLR
jgi:fructose-1-phosphate kinase PfkB-like protein